MGDIHGEYDKYIKCLVAVNFDIENDTLIQLGDIVDRGPRSFEIVEHLTTIKNLIAIRGNHDMWWSTYLNTGTHEARFHHGGIQTLESYTNNKANRPQSHIDFFNNQRNYYVDSNNNLFVHGGFNRHFHINDQQEDIYYWDRDLWTSALGAEMQKERYSFRTKDNFKNIFIGHTPTKIYGQSTPMKARNIWNLDTGAGKYEDGKVTIMNVETKEYYQA